LINDLKHEVAEEKHELESEVDVLEREQKELEDAAKDPLSESNKDTIEHILEDNVADA